MVTSKASPASRCEGASFFARPRFSQPVDREVYGLHVWCAVVAVTVVTLVSGNSLSVFARPGQIFSTMAGVSAGEASCPRATWISPTLGENAITPRCGLAACVGGDGYIYCYGGISNDEDGTFHSDLRRLQIKVNSEGVSQCQWEVLKESGTTPPEGRDASGLLSVGRTLYLVGGATEDDESRSSPQVYTYAIDSGKWDELEVTGSPPLGTNPTYSAVSGKIFVFGGIFDGVPTNSLYMLDIVGQKWTELECTGKQPAPRLPKKLDHCDHAACVIDDCIYVYGGSGGEDLFFSDVFQLDLSTLTWSELKLTGQSPNARDYATLVPYGNEGIIMMGGTKDDKASPGVYYINLKDQEWSLMTPEGDEPTSRFSHAAVIQQSSMVVLAGSTSGPDGDQDLGDVCVLDLPEMKSANANFDPTELPANHFANPPQPVRRRITPAPKLISARDYEETKQTVLKGIADSFDTICEHYLKLDQDKETLRLERAALEEDKKQFEKLQREHEELFEKQHRANDEWLMARRVENDRERQDIANTKERLEQERTKLREERKAFDERNERLKGLMDQFKVIG